MRNPSSVPDDCNSLPDRIENQRSTNPYAPPAPQISTDLTATSNRLLYVWIWLPTAIFGAMLAAPADLISICFAMAFALPCYLCGVVWVSNLSAMHRWLLISACLLIAGALSVPIWRTSVPTVAVIALVFIAANALLGAKSSAAICQNRIRIFGSLSISYLLGLLLGPIGVVILCVPSVLIANRSVRPESG